MKADKYSMDNIAVVPWCEIEDLHGNIKIRIPTDTFMEFLECLDFRSTIINDAYEIVRLQDNIVTVVKGNWDIVEIVSKWLDDNSTGAMIGNVYKHQVKSALLNKTCHLFNRTNLGYIKRITLNRHWDTSDVCYLYFSNTAVKITETGYQCIDYADLDGYVFRDQIIDKEFKI
tara:strand:- start:5417 stop:5935 length:519 start_codon:yes stop_codon:yes gene_type:complete